MRKMILASILLAVASVAGYYGWIYKKFSQTLENSQSAFATKEFKESLSSIDGLRQNRWYKLLLRYPKLDVLQVDKALDYQKGRTLAELGNYKDAYAFFDKCSNANDDQLAFVCLYQQGNVASYMGNSMAEKKWQAALERCPGGHDFDAQVNLELMKSQSKKSQASAEAAMLSHRRGKNPYFFLRPPTTKDGPIKP